jgi:phosphoribosylformylglycinamidine synthase subunit PurL
MEPFEIMTSESQERMLAIVTPENLDRVLETCARWEIVARVVGTVTDTGQLRILDGWDGPVLADVPASSLHDDAPSYDRPSARPAGLDEVLADDPGQLPAPKDCGEDLLALLVDPAWVYRQYDHQLFLNTVVAPGGDAALLRLKAPGIRSEKGLALSTDGNGRWCALDPRLGTALIVAESALNVACVGGRPVALVNCLNFGNPEHPEIMWQLSEAIDGMSEACLALGIPVIGGNVSLYNESRGRDIDPTPVVGTLGLVDRLDELPPGAGLVDGGRILLLGTPSAEGLGGSLWASSIRGHRGGRLPALDLELHSRLVDLVVRLVTDRHLAGVHDVSDGGIGVAVAEMAVKSGVGLTIGGLDSHAELFGEAPSRVIACVAGASIDAVGQMAAGAGIAVTDLGAAGGDRIVIEGLVDLDVADAIAASRIALPRALGIEGASAGAAAS